MKAVKIIGGAIAALVVLVLIVAMVLPSDFKVERSITIDAKPQVVFDYINNVEKQQEWNPWTKRDATMQVTYGDKKVGQGATYSWTGEESGEGHYTIVESSMNQAMVAQVDFGEMGTSTARWQLESTKKGTKTTWSLEGDIPGLMGGFIAPKMDDWVGADYEEGLANLKAVAEAAPKPAPKKLVPRSGEAADGAPADGGGERTVPANMGAHGADAPPPAGAELAVPVDGDGGE